MKDAKHIPKNIITLGSDEDQSHIKGNNTTFLSNLNQTETEEEHILLPSESARKHFQTQDARNSLTSQFNQTMDSENLFKQNPLKKSKRVLPSG